MKRRSPLLLLPICAGLLAGAGGCQRPMSVQQSPPGAPATEPLRTSQPAAEAPPANHGRATGPVPPRADARSRPPPSADNPPPEGGGSGGLPPAPGGGDSEDSLPPGPWLVVRAGFDPVEKTVCSAQWTGGNRLEVHTENVARATLDLRHLPRDAPRHGPWNLQIDRQGIEITGARGKVFDLVRSRNGLWSVDPKSRRVSP